MLSFEVIQGLYIRPRTAFGAIMAALSIPCPQCEANLKIPSRDFLGKKAKCPKCEHRFVLEEPDEVELQLASTVAVTSQPAAMDIPLGLNPVWVPDPGSLKAQPAPVTSGTDSGSIETPPSAPVHSPTPPIQPPVDIPQNVAGDSPFDFSAASSAPVPDFAVNPASTDSSEAMSPAATKTTAPETPRRRGRRSSKNGVLVMSIGSVLFVASMAGLWWQQNSKPKQPVAKNEPPTVNQAWEEQKQQMAADNTASMELSPTSGEPIPMQYMPFTPHLICHLRPAELWGNDVLHREFIATCGHLGSWLRQNITEITRFEPQEIEELTFAINFGPRTTPPQVAAVVRLVSEQRPSDLQLNRFKGQVRPDLTTTVYESDEYSYMPINNKTFVVAPVTMSDSLADAKDFGELPMVDLEKLLKHTDRTRQMTLAFDLVNIDTHREFIFGDQMQDLADRFVLWFGKEVKTISFSTHLRQQEFYVETLLAPTAGHSALTVQKTIQNRMSKLPQDLMAAARMMRPSAVGYREMIGRFPAMMQATFLGTTASVDSGLARLVSYLPPKAAPSLAAASLYTWNQSAVTDFNQKPVVSSGGPTLPDTIAGRLKMPILVDFRRMPLQEAFAYIADEIKTEIVINGDALKLSGMTQNMPQTYNLGEVPAIRAIDAIVSNSDYKGLLVVVVDEAKNRIEVTTRPVATESGLQIYDTKK